MHPNPAYRGVKATRNLEFARQRGFGVLTLAGEDGPLASHVPFVAADDGQALDFHLVRSNPIWRRLRAGPCAALMIVSGPDGYVSPDWYGIDDQAPTWNYVAVHIRGEVASADESGLRAHLEALSASFEARLAPKPAWTSDKMDDGALARMMRMIAPARMRVDAVEGTWKLNQNKPDEARLSAAASMAASGPGAETAALASLMREPPA